MGVTVIAPAEPAGQVGTQIPNFDLQRSVLFLLHRPLAPSHLAYYFEVLKLI